MWNGLGARDLQLCGGESLKINEELRMDNGKC